MWGGHDRMVVGFITTNAISAYHHYRCEFKSHSGWVYSIQHYVIKFVSELRQVDGFLRVSRDSSINKTDRHNITEMLLQVALNTTTLSQTLTMGRSFVPFFLLYIYECVLHSEGPSWS